MSRTEGNYNRVAKHESLRMTQFRTQSVKAIVLEKNKGSVTKS